MAELEKIVARIEADASQLRKELLTVRQQLNTLDRSGTVATRSLGRGFTQLTGAMALARQQLFNLKTLLLSLGATAILHRIVRTAAEFQRLEARMRSVTKTEEEAASAFRALVKFAEDTPNTLQGVVDAFINLSSAGFRPSIEDMTALANVASAMGQSIEAAAGAVVGALVGQTERTQRFGIIARTEGDKIAFTYQGVTTTVDRTSTAVLNFFSTLGQSGKFAGAAKREMDTLLGVFSNLGDAIDVAADAIGKAGLNEEIIKVTRALIDFVQQNPEAVREIGQNLAAAVREAAAAFAFLVEHSRETLSVLAAIAAFTFTPGPPLLKFIAAFGVGAVTFKALATELEKVEAETTKLRRELMNLAGVTSDVAMTWDEFVEAVLNKKITFGEQREEALKLMHQLRDLEDQYNRLVAAQNQKTGAGGDGALPSEDPEVIKERERLAKASALLGELKTQAEGLDTPFQRLHDLLPGISVELLNFGGDWERVRQEFEKVKGQFVDKTLEDQAAAIDLNVRALELEAKGLSHLIPLLQLEEQLRRQFNATLAEEQRARVELALQRQNEAAAAAEVSHFTKDLEDQVALLEAELRVGRELLPIEELRLRLRRQGVELQPLEEERLRILLEQQRQLQNEIELWEGVKDASGEAIKGILKGTKSITEALHDLENAIIDLAIKKAILKPLEDAMDGIFSAAGGLGGGGMGGGFGSIFGSFFGALFGSARGNAFSGPIQPFRKGGVPNRPLAFPTARGVGIMNEAGPEGIFPLARDSAGRLGVLNAGGGGGPNQVDQSRNVTFAPGSVQVNPGSGSGPTDHATMHQLASDLAQLVGPMILRSLR